MDDLIRIETTASTNKHRNKEVYVPIPEASQQHNANALFSMVSHAHQKGNTIISGHAHVFTAYQVKLTSMKVNVFKLKKSTFLALVGS